MPKIYQGFLFAAEFLALLSVLLEQFFLVLQPRKVSIQLFHFRRKLEDTFIPSLKPTNPPKNLLPQQPKNEFKNQNQPLNSQILFHTLNHILPPHLPLPIPILNLIPQLPHGLAQAFDFPTFLPKPHPQLPNLPFQPHIQLPGLPQIPSKFTSNRPNFALKIHFFAQ